MTTLLTLRRALPLALSFLLLASVPAPLPFAGPSTAAADGLATAGDAYAGLARARARRCQAQARGLARLETLEAALRDLGPWAQHLFGRAVARAVHQVALGYADRCVALNQVQVLGSHNSYHVQPVPKLINAYLQLDPNAFQLEYTHRPLPEQLDLGVRQFELDVFYDPDGGLYSEPFGLQLREGDYGARIPELDAPGMKVLHIQDIDWDTTCQTLVACLQQIEDWSLAHPGHLPVFVLIEVKDDVFPDPLGFGFAVPLPFDAAAFDALDAEIRSVFDPAQLVTPDDVRGRFPTLEDAVLAGAWPVLADARGRVLFGLDNGGAKRDTYRAGRPSLEGRVLFTNAVPGDADAAFVKVNGPLGAEDLIHDLVAEGYLVRTRADADTLEARANDTTRRDAALASGAQYVSTDYEEPDPFDGMYRVEIPNGMPGRCNPVNAPPGCRERALERAP